MLSECVRKYLKVNSFEATFGGTGFAFYLSTMKNLFVALTLTFSLAAQASVNTVCTKGAQKFEPWAFSPSDAQELLDSSLKLTDEQKKQVSEAGKVWVDLHYNEEPQTRYQGWTSEGAVYSDTQEGIENLEYTYTRGENVSLVVSNFVGEQHYDVRGVEFFRLEGFSCTTSHWHHD